MSTKPVFSGQEKRLLFILASLQFLHILDFMIMMPMGQQLIRIFAISAEQFSYLVSSYTFSAGFSSILIAFFIDRLDRKKMLLYLHLGFSLGTLACAISRNYHELLIARMVTGAFGGVLSSMVFAIVGDAIGPERRATAMGLLMTAFSFASILGVPFGLWAAGVWDWHAPFTFVGVIGLALVPVIVRLVPMMREHLELSTSRESALQPYLRVFQNPNQAISILFMIMLVFGQFSVINFYSVAMVSNAGLSEAQLPLTYLAGGIISIVSGPLIGRASDRFGHKRVFLISALVSTVPLYLLTRMGPTPLLEILVVTALFFLVMGGRMIPATALVTSACLPQHRGSFMSLISSVQQFSLAGAAFVTGRIVTIGSDNRLENYSTVGTLAIIFTLLALVANRMIVPVEGPRR